MNTPIVFIIFKRPDTTEKVFETIRQAKPTKLFVIADGPRLDRPGEGEKCEAARAIIERVDWDCEVIKNYSDTNLGCAKRVSSGLDWVFSNVEEAIILEDDCVPNSTFFPFCEELLNKYRFDSRIMSISGNNFYNCHLKNQDSYYFSRYFHCWGWATWRRSWQYYDGNMKQWLDSLNNKWLEDILLDSKAVQYWTGIFQLTFDGTIDTWDYPWMFNCWTQSGLSIIPKVNLVTNMGYGVDATHTGNRSSKFSNLTTFGIDFPLKHPDLIIRNSIADDFIQKNNFSKMRLIDRIHNKIKTIVMQS
jgi:hypothetical protein